jgi:GT2 family glycosyltransferase
MSGGAGSGTGGSSEDSPLVFINILNWNGWEETIACLESVFALDYPNYRVTVCDNGSQDGSLDRIRDWAGGRPAADAPAARPPQSPGSARVGEPIPFVESGPSRPADRGGSGGADAPLFLIQTGENLGFTGGHNIGIAHAMDRGARYVLLLNNDTRVEADSLGHLVAAARQADAAIVGARLQQESPFTGISWPAFLFGRGRLPAEVTDERPFWAAFANGCAMLLRRDLLAQRFADCGYYLDPSYFIYCETEDLSLYARARGLGSVIARDAVVHHALTQSMGGTFNPRSYYYTTRNRILIANRWLNLRWKLLFHAYYIPSRLLLQTIGVGGRRWQWRTFHAVGSGLIDGYLGVTGKWKHQ